MNEFVRIHREYIHMYAQTRSYLNVCDDTNNWWHIWHEAARHPYSIISIDLHLGQESSFFFVFIIGLSHLTWTACIRLSSGFLTSLLKLLFKMRQQMSIIALRSPVNYILSKQLPEVLVYVYTWFNTKYTIPPDKQAEA